MFNFFTPKFLKCPLPALNFDMSTAANAMATRILHGFQILEQFSISTIQGSFLKIWLKLAQWFRRRLCLKKLWMDRWTMTLTWMVGNHNSSPPAFGSGELIGTIYYLLLCLKIALWVANCVDPDETPHFVCSSLSVWILTLRVLLVNLFRRSNWW